MKEEERIFIDGETKYYIPERMVESIELYVNHGILPGDFLGSVICNNLKNSVANADEENMKNIPAYVYYFYNYAPNGCWGSYEKMINWHLKFFPNDR